MKKFIFLSITLSFLSSCVVLPETGQKKFIVTSVGQEMQMGEDGYKEVISKSKLANKSPDFPVLQRVGSRIAKATGNTDFKWEYNLIESKELNAWCMPGGKIAVYTAILPIMKTEAGMAAVLGHEVAHATLRHAGQAMTQQYGTQLGIEILGGTIFSNPAYHNTAMAVMGAGSSVGILLPFSRDHETEADLVGLRYMAEAGYDPREALTFWERFAAIISNGAPPEFLSTHPGGETRIQNIKKNMKAAMKIYTQSKDKLGVGAVL